jgi:dynein heavy chain
VKKQNEFTETLDLLENTLLDSLNSADSATILENKELIENLDKTKKTTLEIQTQQE